MSAELVTCPACGGTGQQEVEYGADIFNVRSRGNRRTRPCFSCKATGLVEAARCCLTCGKFVDMCICPRDRDVQTTKLEDTHVGTGVTWNERQGRWIAGIYKEGKQHYLGAFEDKALAEGIRSEAERMPVSEYPALRKNYRQARKQPQASVVHITQNPVAPAEEVVLDHFLGLVQEALAADATLRKRRHAARLACDDANTAEQVAIAAWNAVIEALRDLSGADSAFTRSEFGSILLTEVGRD